MNGYVFRDATGDVDDPQFIAVWRELLSRSDNSQKIYQSPEYFSFVRERSAHTSRRLICLEIREEKTGQICGIVPISSGSMSLAMPITRSIKIPIKVPALDILGSEPLMPMRADLVTALLRFVHRTIVPSPVLSMQAMRASGDFYKHLSALEKSSPLLNVFVADGFRDCHVTQLPSSFAQYQALFSSKKKYNLNRQVRLLKEAIPGLRLRRLTTREDVPALLQAIEKFHTGERPGTAESFEAQADRNMLLCYVLEDDAAQYGVVVGKRHGAQFYVHNINCDATYQKLSIGTSIMHMVIEDLTDVLQMSSIDYGYGSPTYQYNASNIVESRGRVMVSSRRLALQMLFFAHELHRRTSVYVKKAVGRA